MEIQWSLVLFTALTGLAGWLFFFVGLNTFVKKTNRGTVEGSVVALVLLIVGGLASVTHLSHPDRMLGALQHPTSGIFVEAVLVGLLAIVIAAFIVMMRKGVTGTALKAVAAIGMVLGALMSFMAGQSYLMAAIPAWNTELLPLGYLGTAFAEGAAAWLVLLAAKKADEGAIKFAGMAALIGGAAGAATVLVYAAVSGSFGIAGALPWFAGSAVLAAAAAACGWIVSKKPGQAPALGGAAVACALIAAIAFRCGMWAAGISLYGFFGLI